MSNPLFDRKPIRETIARKVSTNAALRKAGIRTPVIDQVRKDILRSRGLDPINKLDPFEERVQREIADRFDIEAEIKKAEAAIALSQKIHDPENDHLFTAEAAQEAFKDVKL